MAGSEYRYLGATHFGPYGEVLQWGSKDALPECGENQVLISVAFTEVNPVDLQKLQPHKAGQEIPSSPLIVGYGGSGVVVLSKVDGMKEQDPVVFLADPRRAGAYATHVVVDAQCVTKIPSDYPLSKAASLPLSGCTAYESLDKLSLQNAKNLLIVGGAGGVGSWAMAICKAKYPDLQVFCTASSSDSKSWCTEYGGASRVMGHDEILTQLEGGRQGSVDRILCLTEPKPDLWKAMTEVIRPYGTICLVVAGASLGSLDLGFAFFKSVTVTTETVFSSQRTNFSHNVPAKHMEDMLHLLATGAVKPPVQQDAASWRDCQKEGGLLDQLASGHTQGKLVMKID